MKTIKPHNRKWQNWSSLRSAVLHAPRGAGVYAFGRSEHVLGLPISQEWAYVGRTSNLKRRLLEHTPNNEANPELKAWIMNSGPQIDVWYLQTTPEQSRNLEKKLIRALKPKHNVVQYRGDSYHG